ncbi:hypothetical protein LCGC14_3026040, partial [marine sediment metagenome]
SDNLRIAAGAPSVDFEMGMSNFTIEAWVLMKSSLANSQAIGMGKLGGNSGWQLLNLASGQWRFFVGNGTVQIDKNAGTDTRDDKWHLITVVIDRTADTLAFYRDGAFTNSNDISAVTGNVNGSGAVFNINGNFVNDVIWVDELCVTKRKLTVTEMVARYNGRTMYGDWGM